MRRYPLCPSRRISSAGGGVGGGSKDERLDLPTEEGLARAGKRLVEAKSAEDRFERMERDFHDRLRNGFLEIAKSDPLRCKVIDASGDIAAVSDKVRLMVSETLGVSFS